MQKVDDLANTLSVLSYLARFYFGRVFIECRIVADMPGLGHVGGASGAHIDFGRAPYLLYGVKYIGLVSLRCPFQAHRSSSSDSHIDLSCAPYVLQPFKYIDLVSLAPLPGMLFASSRLDAALAWPRALPDTEKHPGWGRSGHRLRG